MRHLRPSKKRRLPRALITWVLAAAVVIGSVVTAVANSVDITVHDGDDVYTFSLIGADAESILARAKTEGMAALSDVDAYVLSDSDTVMTIQRNVRLSVDVDGSVHILIVPEGAVLGDMLAENGMILDEDDLVEPAADTVLLRDTQAKITRVHQVNVAVDGGKESVDIQEGTVADALEALGVTLDERDTVTPAAETALSEGMEVVVRRYKMVSVLADAKLVSRPVTAYTVEEAVLDAGITLGEMDRIYITDGITEIPAERSDYAADGVGLRVERIYTEEVTVDEIIEHGIVYEEVDGIFRDQQTVLTKGEDGEKRVTYTVTYADGVEEGRVAIAEEVLVPAVDEVVRRGKERRADEFGRYTFTDHLGDTVGYEWKITGECTAYSWEAGNVTSTGESVQFGYVAVDPKIIPYGSLLYITSPYGTWNYGYCYAMDTGGAALSGRIIADLFYDSEDYCNVFGRRQMTVYVIQEGGHHGW